MRDLNQFFDDIELINPPMLGRKFTRSSQDWEKWSSIDRLLLHPEWLDKFKLKQWGLPRTLSNHAHSPRG